MTNMKAYKDGNRLILVLENPDASLENLVKSFLMGIITPIEHLETPSPMAIPLMPSKDAVELEVTSPQVNKTPKFVQRSQDKSASMRTINVANQEATNAAAPESTIQNIPNPVANEAEDTISMTTVYQMNIFALRDFLRKHHDDQRIRDFLIQRMRTTNLELVLYTKTERELREIARELAS